MAPTTFNPKTRQYNEREVSRVQEDFSGGLLNDLPKVPDNGVYELENFINFGDYLEGRSGSREWGDYTTNTAQAPVPSLSGRTGYTLTKTGSLVTATVGANFSASDIGNYVVYDDGSCDRIISYSNTTNVGVANSTVRPASTAAYIRGQVNGVYFHKSQKKIILHIDTRVFVSDIYMSSWVEWICISIDKPSNSLTKIDEYNQFVFLFNSNGIFRIDLSGSKTCFYKVNTPVPDRNLVNVGSIGGATPYGRRYVYTMSRLRSGNFNVNRLSDGVSIEAESGSCAVYERDKVFRDYSEVATAKAISSVDYTDADACALVSVMDVPRDKLIRTKASTHWTHFSLYCTKDVGANGTGSLTSVGNNPELFIWLDDTPLIKPFICNVDGITVTASDNIFSVSDIGTTIAYSDGGLSVIATYVNAKQVTIGAPATYINDAASIGYGDIFKASHIGSVITRTTGTFTSTDIGRVLFLSDGRTTVIQSLVSSTAVNVDETGNSPLIVAGKVRDTTIVGRSYMDFIPDETLSSRISSLTLNQRLWEPLPNCNDGVVVPGFVVCCARGDSKVNYSEIPQGYEETVGYHFSPFQFAAFKDDVMRLSYLNNNVVVYCKNSTGSLDSSIVDTQTRDELGLTYTVITSQRVIDGSIGILDSSAVCKINNGMDFVITNEPGCRMFSGEKYSEDLADGRISNELRKMEFGYTIHYDPFNGVLIWGKK